jgi:tRNA(Ile2) C34 agmatinyltransferase TiaS
LKVQLSLSEYVAFAVEDADDNVDAIVKVQEAFDKFGIKNTEEREFDFGYDMDVLTEVRNDVVARLKPKKVIWVTKPKTIEVSVPVCPDCNGDMEQVPGTEKYACGGCGFQFEKAA